MSLPEELDDLLEAELLKIEKERSMTQTMSPMLRRAHEQGEKIGVEKGEKIGESTGQVMAMRNALLQLIDHKFGITASEIGNEIEQASDIQTLNALYTSALNAQSIADISLPRE